MRCCSKHATLVSRVGTRRRRDRSALRRTDQPISGRRPIATLTPGRPTEWLSHRAGVSDHRSVRAACALAVSARSVEVDPLRLDAGGGHRRFSRGRRREQPPLTLHSGTGARQVHREVVQDGMTRPKVTSRSENVTSRGQGHPGEPFIERPQFQDNGDRVQMGGMPEPSGHRPPGGCVSARRPKSQPPSHRDESGSGAGRPPRFDRCPQPDRAERNHSSEQRRGPRELTPSIPPRPPERNPGQRDGTRAFRKERLVACCRGGPRELRPRNHHESQTIICAARAFLRHELSDRHPGLKSKALHIGSGVGRDTRPRISKGEPAGRTPCSPFRHGTPAIRAANRHTQRL